MSGAATFGAAASAGPAGWRILQVVRSLRPETGGLAEAVRSLSPALRALGHRSVTLSLDPADKEGEGTLVLGRSSDGYGYSPDYVPWLRAHRGDFDAVIVHGMWQYPGLGAWRALRGTDTPYLVYCHGMLDPWFRRAYPLKHLKKWLYWPWAEYRILRDAAAVCFTSEEERVQARRSFWLYRAREVVAPIGIDAPPGDAERQRAAFAAAHPALAGHPFLLFLGRIHPKKGVDLLLRAYASVAGPGSPSLVIAGPSADAACLAELKSLSDQLGLADRVHWLPMLKGDVKWGALHGCEAFVLFSHQENFGVAVVEALACARPVLISEQVNLWREIVADGAGFAAPDDAAGAASALTRWQELEPGRRSAMGAAAGACFERRFSLGRAAEGLAALVGTAARGRIGTKPSPSSRADP